MKKLPIARIVMGLLVIVVGAALLLNNLGVAPFGEIIRKGWPMVVVVLGLTMLLNNTRHYLWALIVVAAGVLWQLNVLDIIAVNVWQLFWPVVIIAAGISIIVNRVAMHGGKLAAAVSQAERDDITAILSGSEQKNHSEGFKASKITTVMGGVMMDLREATIKKEATVEVFSLMGGVELRVPETVQVKCSTSNILGGVENKTRAPEGKNAPVLHVIGDVILGGIEIKN